MGIKNKNIITNKKDFPTINIFGNRKGGVGKSTISFGYLCYITNHISRNLKHTIYINTDKSSDSIDRNLSKVRNYKNYQNKVKIYSREFSKAIAIIEYEIENNIIDSRDTIIIDLQGDQIKEEDIRAIDKYNPYWIIPTIPHYLVELPSMATISDLIESNVSHDRIVMLLNEYPNKFSNEIKERIIKFIQEYKLLYPYYLINGRREILPIVYSKIGLDDSKSQSIASNSNCRITMCKLVELIKARL